MSDGSGTRGTSGARPLRVVLTGSECTGKTTLAHQLAQAYGAELVREYAREYAAGKHGELDIVDVEPIARGQMLLEDTYASHARELIVQDTDLLSTLVYSGHYYDYRPQWLVDAVRARRPDLYLLLETDVPWTADGVRDRGNAREEMQQLFRDAVAGSGAPYVVIRGSREGRLELARDAIGHLLAARE